MDQQNRDTNECGDFSGTSRIQCEWRDERSTGPCPRLSTHRVMFKQGKEERLWKYLCEWHAHTALTEGSSIKGVEVILEPSQQQIVEDIEARFYLFLYSIGFNHFDIVPLEACQAIIQVFADVTGYRVSLQELGSAESHDIGHSQGHHYHEVYGSEPSEFMGGRVRIRPYNINKEE